jgi:hypothetical protein
MSVLRLTLVLAITGCTPHAREPEGEPEPARAPALPEPEPEPEPEPVEPAQRRETRGHLARAWPEPAPDDPAFSCTRDEQCQLVHMDACDECNGGWVLSVRPDHVDAIKARYGKRDRTRCTLVNCVPEVQPVCVLGVCAAHRPPLREDSAHGPTRRPERGRARKTPTVYRNHVPPG